jgi:Ca-activated chloride channel family protein
VCLVLLLLLCSPRSSQADWLDFWLTPDQQGERLFQRGDYRAAAQKFTTPDRIGVALFRAGEFEQAAAVLGRSPLPEAAYNRGNALIMLGQYQEAIDSFNLALERQPGWLEAQENLEIARLRLAALSPPDDDFGGTGGQLAADEVLFDDTGRVNKSTAEEVTEEGHQTLSDASMRALWLRRVETRPGDFLTAKFAYQLAVQNRQEPEGD